MFIALKLGFIKNETAFFFYLKHVSLILELRDIIEQL